MVLHQMMVIKKCSRVQTQQRVIIFLRQVHLIIPTLGQWLIQLTTCNFWMVTTFEWITKYWWSRLDSTSDAASSYLHTVSWGRCLFSKDGWVSSGRHLNGVYPTQIGSWILGPNQWLLYGFYEQTKLFNVDFGSRPKSAEGDLPLGSAVCPWSGTTQKLLLKFRHFKALGLDWMEDTLGY